MEETISQRSKFVERSIVKSLLMTKCLQITSHDKMSPPCVRLPPRFVANITLCSLILV
jgi:hypothetical protein